MPPRLIYAKRRKARNTQSEAGTSQANVTVLTEDEKSDAPFVAARSSTVGLRRSSRNRRPPVSTPSDERETAIPTFALLEGYSGGGNQVEMLTQDFLCWQGLQSHKPEGELGYDDPTESFQIAHRQIREVGHPSLLGA